MTRKEKRLLLADLSARLPYGVKVNNKIQGDFKVYGICEDAILVRDKNKVSYIVCIEKIKPYLFPLSSMTVEQKEEYKYITERWMYDSSYSISDSIDWLNKNHFDYRGLIDKGLAFDCTNLNIY